jgi:hypothetical protein
MDEVDVGNAYAEKAIEIAIANRASAVLVNEGAGECEQCEEEVSRLVGGLCVACRNIEEKRYKMLGW